MSREVEWQGKYIRVVRDGTWEYVERCGGVHAVVILAEFHRHQLEAERVAVRVVLDRSAFGFILVVGPEYLDCPILLSITVDDRFIR